MAGNSIQSFIARWTAASASERANSPLFLSEWGAEHGNLFLN